MKEDVRTKQAGLAGAERQTSNVKRQTSKDERAAPIVYDLEERLLQYSARIVRLVDSMPKTRGANHVGGQLLRSGTSPLSNHGEAQAAESVDNFIHKLKISKKELIESHRWLRLICLAPMVRKPEWITPLIDETDQLIRIIAKSLHTAEARRDNRIQEIPSEPDIDRWLIHFDSTFSVRRSTFDVRPPPGPPAEKPVRYSRTSRKSAQR